MALWDGIIRGRVEGPALKPALQEIFECLVETDRCRALVDDLAAAARAAYPQAEQLVIEYRASSDDHLLKFGLPYHEAVAKYPEASAPLDPAIPPSYLRLAMETNWIAYAFRTPEGQRRCSWSGIWPGGEIPYVNRVDGRHHLAACELWGGWICYHRTERTSLGEPALFPYVHGRVGPPLTRSLAAPATFLRILFQEILHGGSPLWID